MSSSACTHAGISTNGTKFWCSACRVAMNKDGTVKAFGELRDSMFAGHSSGAQPCPHPGFIGDACIKCGEVVPMFGQKLKDPPYGVLTTASSGKITVGHDDYPSWSDAVIKHEHKFTHASGEDGLRCPCGVFISGQSLDAFMGSRKNPYDAERNRLSDECGRLLTENRQLAGENSDLRRENDRLKRKDGQR
jgi:hypothetical protein